MYLRNGTGTWVEYDYDTSIYWNLVNSDGSRTVYFKAADLFGFASVTETQGLVTMEAMAAGLPVVAVDASGTRDIVDNGEQGFLVPNDPEALAASIMQLIESPKTMQNFSKKALKKAKIFDLEARAKQLTSTYEQAIQNKADGRYVRIYEGGRKERQDADANRLTKNAKKT